MTVAYRVQSACECQAVLEADLDEHRLVLRGTARRGRDSERAPANSVEAGSSRFDVVWRCPFCGRNPLRTFYAGALARVEAPALPVVEAGPDAPAEPDAVAGPDAVAKPAPNPRSNR
ncbi:MAG: hypothetical protein AAGN82_16405 [Myxococcota bacterium]